LALKPWNREDIAFPEQYSRRGRQVMGSFIDSSLSLLARQTHPVISLAMGCPGPDAFPLDDIARVVGEIMGREAAVALNYGPTEGDALLRRQLLEAEAVASDLEVNPDCLIVTSGGMQGLDLVNKLLINPGDIVVAELPSYSNGLATVHNYEGRLTQIPLDAEGLSVAECRNRFDKAAVKPKLFYVIPSFQNPSGITMSLGRRHELLDLARSYRAMVLEDDPYGDLRFEGESVPSLFALDKERGTVISVRTFSKIFSPGIRVGWVLAPRNVIAKMVAAKQSMDTCTNILGQKIVGRLMAEGTMRRHILRLRQEYRLKRDLMLASLDRRFGREPGFTWTRPEGGFFLWMTFPEGVSAEALFPVALAGGVAFIPGPAFTVHGGLTNAVRLCFTYPLTHEIDEAIRRLRTAYQSSSARRIGQP
jgi:2-aminoadipate transaminase